MILFEFLAVLAGVTLGVFFGSIAETLFWLTLSEVFR